MPLAGLLLAASTLVAPAQTPRIGLALSGGAARGLAHIGVLRVLEQAGLPVDVIAGTSMGSVLGGLYAIGYDATQLETIVKTQAWPRLLTDPVDRRDLSVDRKISQDRYLLTLPIEHGGIHLPRGVVAGQRIWELLTRLTWSAHGVRDFRRLPIAFAAVATDLETGRAVVLDHGFLPDAMRASMALPSVFAPVEVEGRVLIDGGVVRNLPAQDARALGADVLICSDVTDPLEPRDSIVSLVDVLVQSMSFRIWDAESAERARCDVLITPDVRGFGAFGFDRADELIARGEAAARAALPRIEQLAGGARRRATSRARLAEPDSLLLVAVRSEPPLPGQTLGVQPPLWISPGELGERIERLYATGRFASVRYRLDTAGADSARRTLTVLTSPRPAGRFALGLRYDSRYKASVLLARTLGNDLELHARLGQQIDAGIERLGTPTVGAAFTHVPFDVFAGGRRVSEGRVDLGALTATVSHGFGTAAAVALRVKGEHARWAEEVAAVDSAPINRTFATVSGDARLDTYDYGLFPTRGVALEALSEWSSDFSHHLARGRAFVPLARRVSLWAGATLGASGGTPPPHYLFTLGGANSYSLFDDRAIPFVGLHVQERRGRHVQAVELGAQWQVSADPDLFARARWNAGTVLDGWTFHPSQYTNGGGVELGARTVAGRVSLSVSGSGNASPLLELDLGYPF